MQHESGLDETLLSKNNYTTQKEVRKEMQMRI